MRHPALFFLLPACAAGLFAGELQFTHEEPGVWTLQNSVARVVFELDSAGRFGMRSFENLETGDAWAPPADKRSSPVRLRVSGAAFDADTAFRLVEHSSGDVPRLGRQQSIALEDSRRRGRLTLELELYEGQPVLRYRVRYRNLTAGRVTVQRANMLPWSLNDELRPVRAFRVKQWVNYGKSGNFEPLSSTLARGGPGATLRTGAHGQHCAWLAVRDSADRGLVAGLEFDGRATVNARQTESSLELSAEIDELNRPVPPGEEFVLPWAFLGSFKGDWDEAAWVTQRFAEGAIAQAVPGQDFPYVMWDSWKYQTGFDQETLFRNATIAARLGVEVFVVDLGWSRHIGDWHEHPGKFSPGGLRALSEHVRSLGMKFGLHFAFAEAAAQSPVLRQNPDWTSSDTYGYFDAQSLCLSHAPVKNWVVAEAVRMIDEYQVDWILQDGENMVKRCTKATHTHDPQDSNYSNAVDGLNYVVQAVQEARPETLWENCEDGGNMMTFNMLRNYVTSIAADDSGPLTTRQAIFGITYPFPTRYANRYMPDEELNPYITRSFMFGGPWIFMNRLEQMREEDLDFAASEIALFKRIRKQIREGRVYHLKGRPSETGIDALQSHHAATDRSIVFVFRVESAAGIRVLRLRGVKPDGRYRVRFEGGTGPASVVSGAQLLQGMPVRLPGMWSAHVIYVDPAGGEGQAGN